MDIMTFGDMMKYELIIDELKKHDVKLVTFEGNEIILSNKDVIQKKDGNLIIIKDEEITLSLDDIDQILPLKKSRNSQIRALKRQGQINRH